MSIEIRGSMLRITAGARSGPDDGQGFHSLEEWKAQLAETAALRAQDASGFSPGQAKVMARKFYPRAEATTVQHRPATSLDELTDRVYGQRRHLPSAAAPTGAVVAATQPTVSEVRDLVVETIDVDAIYARYNAPPRSKK